MAEPQPSQIHEGDQAPSAVPGSNKSEAAALDSLDRQTDTTTASKSGDAKALGQAMQKLDVADKSKPKDVKVEAGDVGLLAEHLDISRPQATELLKANDADPVKAMRAWIAA